MNLALFSCIRIKDGLQYFNRYSLRNLLHPIFTMPAKNIYTLPEMGTKNYFACTRSGISYSKINSVRNENIQRFILQEIVCKELLCQK